jgi:hypothetical protein
MGFSVASNKKYNPRKPKPLWPNSEAISVVNESNDLVYIGKYWLHWPEARKLSRWLEKACDYLESREK